MATGYAGKFVALALAALTLAFGAADVRAQAAPVKLGILEIDHAQGQVRGALLGRPDGGQLRPEHGRCLGVMPFFVELHRTRNEVVGCRGRPRCQKHTQSDDKCRSSHTRSCKHRLRSV